MSIATDTALNESHFAVLEQASEALNWLESVGVKSTYMIFAAGQVTLGLKFPDLRKLFPGQSVTTTEKDGRKHYALVVDRVQYTSSLPTAISVVQEVL